MSNQPWSLPTKICVGLSCIVVVGLSVGLGVYYGVYGAGGTATLQLQNAADKTTSRLLRTTTADFSSENSNHRSLFQGLYGTNPTTPSYVGVKMLAVYVAQDVDNTTQQNIGTSAIFWLNSECTSIDTCTSEKVTKFFNFSAPSSLLNAEITKQNRLIEANTYKYIRLEFCKNGAISPNWVVNHPGFDTPLTWAMNQCGVTAKIDPPIVATASTQFIVTVEFDVRGSVTEVACGSSSIQCKGIAQTNGKCYCFWMPDFIPSAKISATNLVPTNG
jgi:hypothetical protein